jgi:hypothetical protein
MKDIIYFFSLSIISFLIGFPISRLMSKKIYKFRILISGTAGFGIIATLSTIMYKSGLSVNIIYKSTLISAAILLPFLILNVFVFFKKNRKDIIAKIKPCVTILFLWIIGSIILLSPKFIGGNQFGVFQGNAWDTFGYVNSATVYSRMSYNEIMKSADSDILVNPLIAYAKENLHLRPSVHILYAVTGQIFSNSYHLLYYTFLIFLLSQIIFTIIFFLINIFPDKKYLIIGICSLALPLGFYGQYILDINAWSQISSISICSLIVFSSIIFLVRYQDIILNSIGIIKILLFLILINSFGLYLYPENFLFHTATLFAVLFIYFIYCIIKKINFFPIFIVLISSLLGFFSGFIVYYGVIDFLFSQTVTGGFSQPLTFWKYFQAYFMGYDGINVSIFENISDFISGIAGIFFITPSKNENVCAKFILRMMALFVIFGVIRYVFNYFKTVLNIKPVKLRINKKIFFYLLILTIPLFWILQTGIYIGLFKYTDTIKIKVNSSSEFDDMKIIRISTTDNKYLVKKTNGCYYIENNYCTKLLLEIKPNVLSGLKSIEVLVGNKIFRYEYEKILTWEKINQNENLIYQFPEQINNGKKSVINKFRNIINWKGDFNILFETFPIDYCLFLIIILLYWFLIRRDLVLSKFNYTAGKKIIFFLTVLTLIFMVPIMIFLLKSNFWAAGKAITYISPYLLIILVIPLIDSSERKIVDYLKNPLFILIILQLSFGFLRIYNSANSLGIHYLYPYPGSENPPGLKKKIDWDMKTLDKYLSKSDIFRIDVEDRWLENYLFLILFQNDKIFYTTNIVNEYFGDIGNGIGFQKETETGWAIMENDVEENIIRCENKNDQVYFINQKIKLVKSDITARFGPGFNSSERVIRWIEGYFNYQKPADIDKEILYCDNTKRWMKDKSAQIIIYSSQDNRKVKIKMDYFNPFSDFNFDIIINGKKIGEYSNSNEVEIKEFRLKKGRNIFEIDLKNNTREYQEDWYPRNVGIGISSFVIEAIDQ